MKKEITGEDEDLIYKNLKFIQELTRVKELYFETLVAELGLNKKGEDWLFDYIYNSEYDTSEDFPSYLENYGVDQTTIFAKS